MTRRLVAAPERVKQLLYGQRIRLRRARVLVPRARDFHGVVSFFEWNGDQFLLSFTPPGVGRADDLRRPLAA